MTEKCENCKQTWEECEDSRPYLSDNNVMKSDQSQKFIQEKFKFIIVAVTELPKDSSVYNNTL